MTHNVVFYRNISATFLNNYSFIIFIPRHRVPTDYYGIGGLEVDGVLRETRCYRTVNKRVVDKFNIFGIRRNGLPCFAKDLRAIAAASCDDVAMDLDSSDIWTAICIDDDAMGIQALPIVHPHKIMDIRVFDGDEGSIPYGDSIPLPIADFGIFNHDVLGIDLDSISGQPGLVDQQAVKDPVVLIDTQARTSRACEITRSAG